jgi:hypothetical protein
VSQKVDDPLDLIRRYSYWDIIEAALTSLPESSRLRSPALASFDHLKERVTDPAARAALDRHTRGQT